MIVLTNDAVSFCHYDSKDYFTDIFKIMNFEQFQEIVSYCSLTNIVPTFILGRMDLPPHYLELIESINHIKIAPLCFIGKFQNSIWVIDSDENNAENVKVLAIQAKQAMAIFRLAMKDIDSLAAKITSYSRYFKRINLVLCEIEKYSESEIFAYSNQINKLIESTTNQIENGNIVELNCITDRIFSETMRNCNAGISHITIGFDGHYYLCPGFIGSSNNNHLGCWGKEYEIKNSNLLSLNSSPICGLCDAYHCKRCVYLNKKMTEEINTPSYEYCVLTHIERNASLSMRDRLLEKGIIVDSKSCLSEIQYFDPFEILKLKSLETNII